MLQYFFPYIVPRCMDAYQRNAVFFVRLLVLLRSQRTRPPTEKILATAMIFIIKMTSKLIKIMNSNEK